MTAHATGTEVPEVGRFSAELERMVDRLRTLSEPRLARPHPPHASVADAARALAQLLADTAAELGLGGELRRVPRLPDLAVGDQVAVTGHDVLLACAHPLDLAGLERVTVASDACRALRLEI